MNRFVLALLLIGLNLCVHAGDWPQWLGEHRDGQASDETLNDWQKQKPKVLWKVDIGSGYAGAAVSKDDVVVSHRRDDEERLSCFHAVDGSQVWEAKFPATYQTMIDPDAGPRCVPNITESSVIMYGAAGDLRCVDRKSGQIRWQTALREQFEAPDGYFGAGSSPLIVGERIIVCVGGKQAGVAAVSLKDGQVLWKSEPSEAAYASPVLLTRANDLCVLCVMRLEAWLVNLDNGQVIARTKFGARGPTVNAATPIVRGSQAFLTASYGIGGTVVDWTASPKVVWANDTSLSSQYITPVLRGDCLYGIHGREDHGTGNLRCVRLSDGRVLWDVPGFGIAHCIATKSDLLAISTGGEVTRFAANESQYEARGKFDLPDAGKYRALPALSNGILYCRGTDQQRGSLVAVRVGEKP